MNKQEAKTQQAQAPAALQSLTREQLRSVSGGGSSKNDSGSGSGSSGKNDSRSGSSSGKADTRNG